MGHKGRVQDTLIKGSPSESVLSMGRIRSGFFALSL